MMDDEEDVEAECEGFPQQQEMDFTPNTFPSKPLFPTDSTPLLIDSLTFDDDVKEKSQIHNQARDSEIYTPKVDVVSAVPTAIMSTINSAVTKILKHTSWNQQHSTISSSMPPTVQLPKGISISPCNFSVGLSAFTQNHSSPSSLHSLSEVELKCFDPGGMIPLLFLPISSIFISVQFPLRVSLPIPPEPPDWVVVQSSSLKLPLCVTTKGIAPTQYLDMHSFPILLIVLQLFDEMPECHITVWSAIINRCMDNEQVVAYGLFKDMHKMHNAPDDFEEYFEEKHMLCTARLVEMLNVYASNLGNYAESDPKKNFLIEEIKVLEEAKWISLPNFMPQAAFFSLQQIKLGVSTQRAGEELIAKKKNSIQHVMEVVECGKTKVTGPLLDGLCIKVPKVLAPEPQLADTCSYCSDIFYDGSSFVFANIHCYFDDSAVVRIFDFISKAGGNEIASLLSFMKLYTYPIDNSYRLNMISHAIRHFTFECSGMTIDDAFRRLSLLLTEHFAAEIEVFAIVHVIGVKHFVHRRKSKSIGKACSRHVEVGVWILSIPLVKNDNIIHNHPGVFYLMEGIYTNTVFIEFTEKEWIFLVNSSIFALMLWHLLALLHKIIGFSAIKVIGAMFVLFMNLEFHSLTRQELNLKKFPQYHIEYFFFVAMFEIQRYSRVGNLLLKMISDSINGNVFKPTSEVYFVAGKGYMRMMCGIKVDYVAVDKLVASTLVHLLYSWQVMNQVPSLQQLPFLNICYCHAPEFSFTSGKNRIVVYSPHVWKFDTTILYVISYPLIKESLMFLQHVVLVGVLHRKTIYNGSFQGPKILTKLKDWPPKHGTRKFAANVDLVAAILH